MSHMNCGGDASIGTCTLRRIGSQQAPLRLGARQSAVVLDIVVVVRGLVATEMWPPTESCSPDTWTLLSDRTAWLRRPRL